MQTKYINSFCNTPNAIQNDKIEQCAKQNQPSRGFGSCHHVLSCKHTTHFASGSKLPLHRMNLYFSRLFITRQIKMQFSKFYRYLPKSQISFVLFHKKVITWNFVKRNYCRIIVKHLFAWSDFLWNCLAPGKEKKKKSVVHPSDCIDCTFKSKQNTHRHG